MTSRDPQDNRRGRHARPSSSASGSNPSRAHRIPTPQQARPSQRPYRPDAGRSASSRGRASQPFQPAQTRRTAQPNGNPQQPYVSMLDIQSARNYSRGSAAYQNHRRRSKQKMRKRIFIGVGAVLLVLVAFFAALGFSAINVKNQIPELVSTANALQKDLKAEDSSALTSDATKLNKQISNLRDEVNNPLWSIGCFIPILGEDISAAQKLINVAGDLSEEVLMPLSNVISTYPLNTIYSNGNLNGNGLKALCNTLADAAPTISASAETVDSIGEVHFEQINNLTEKLRDPLNLAAQFMADNGDAFRLLPAIVGCDGTRQYLVVAQNYAEVRPTGGLPGSVIPLTVTNGEIDFGDTVAMADARKQEYPIQITNEERALFTEKLGSSSTDMNSTPDWARAGDIIAQMWAIYRGTTVDGVIGVDVKTFSRLVGLATSTVTLPDGSTIKTDDLTKILLHDTYINYSSNEQDAYFSMVLGSCMKIIKTQLPKLNLQKISGVLTQAIDEERFMVWMRNPAEEALMEQAGCAGTLSYDPKVPEVGLYFYDLTWSKIDWYFKPTVTIGQAVRNADGTTSYPMTITLTNTLTNEEAERVPVSVTGVNGAKADKSEMLTNVYLYSPAGGSISDIKLSDRSKFELYHTTHNGLEVNFGLLRLKAQESETITCTVTVSSEAEEPLELRMMQTAQS